MASRHTFKKYHTEAVRDDKNLDRIINERGLVGFLSNAKWVKILDTLVVNYHLIKECQVKLIWEEEYTGRILLINENTYYQFDYYNSAMEAMITGGPSGWYDYREIEWLAFPHYPAKQSGEQDLHGIQAAIASIGQIALTVTPDTLRLDAYRSSAS